MEAYTSLKIKMENDEMAMIAADKAELTVKDTKFYTEDRRNISSFINDINASGDEMIVDLSCSLDSYEYNQIIQCVWLFYI